MSNQSTDDIDAEVSHQGGSSHTAIQTENTTAESKGKKKPLAFWARLKSKIVTPFKKLFSRRDQQAGVLDSTDDYSVENRVNRVNSETANRSTSDKIYPDTTEIVSRIRKRCLGRDNSLKQKSTPVPNEAYYVHMGGSIAPEYMDYMAVCINAAGNCKTNIWVDSEFLLVNETNELIKNLYGKENRPELTDDDRINSIVAMREDFYNALKDKPATEREVAWIDWLEANCGVSKEYVVQRLNELKKEMANLPADLSKQSGIPADQIQIKEISTLFDPPAEATPEEKQCLASLRKHYERELLLRQNPACASDMVRPLPFRIEGGFYRDTDRLPAIKPELTDTFYRQADLPPELVNGGQATLAIQDHLFSGREQWFRPTRQTDDLNEADVLSDAIKDFFEKQNITSIKDVFQPLGAISAPKDLLLMQKQIKGFSNSAFAAHKGSPMLSLVSIQQTKNLDYVEKFNEAFKQKLAEDGRSGLTPAQTLQARMKFLLETYEPQHPLPLPEAISANRGLKAAYMQAIAEYPFDGLLPDCRATMTLTGPRVFSMLPAQLAGTHMPGPQLNNIFEMPKILCDETVLDSKSSWLLKNNAPPSPELTVEVSSEIKDALKKAVKEQLGADNCRIVQMGVRYKSLIGECVYTHSTADSNLEEKRVAFFPIAGGGRDEVLIGYLNEVQVGEQSVQAGVRYKVAAPSKYGKAAIRQADLQLSSTNSLTK